MASSVVTRRAGPDLLSFLSFFYFDCMSGSVARSCLYLYTCCCSLFPILSYEILQPKNVFTTNRHELSPEQRATFYNKQQQQNNKRVIFSALEHSTYANKIHPIHKQLQIYFVKKRNQVTKLKNKLKQEYFNNLLSPGC